MYMYTIFTREYSMAMEIHNSLTALEGYRIPCTWGGLMYTASHWPRLCHTLQPASTVHDAEVGRALVFTVDPTRYW